MMWISDVGVRWGRVGEGEEDAEGGGVVVEEAVERDVRHRI